MQSQESHRQWETRVDGPGNGLDLSDNVVNGEYFLVSIKPKIPYRLDPYLQNLEWARFLSPAQQAGHHSEGEGRAAYVQRQLASGFVT